MYLPAGVVDIVLGADIVARATEQVGQRPADGGAAPVPHVQRSRGIGAHELQQHPLATSQRRPSVLLPLRFDLR